MKQILFSIFLTLISGSIQYMYLLRPSGKSKKPLHALVYFTGGGWVGGDLRISSKPEALVLQNPALGEGFGQEFFATSGIRSSFHNPTYQNKDYLLSIQLLLSENRMVHFLNIVFPDGEDLQPLHSQ